ncbi:hypothetical protein G647_00816 [Cladophialophora carrionii CBS 160.54]|uniref:SnoaL-like domain-containing protein n=1 Tax=Cladophialophora carrionii CBS 160.54 TaxID=1279043 RepID=V9DR14_9EURO|nr:uncharacterized protein G647_00816 [Cladophialophora carrionii CBS 160.54]ETI28367.1 hypothetical protein G647_00816 [Cladophialophora carrionii CBS 160.54]
MASVSTTGSEAVHAQLKHLYHTYRHTQHIPSKASFFSPTCMQVCRTIPSYAAVKRDTIIQYLLEAAGFQDVESYERAQSSSATAESRGAEAPDDEERRSAPVKVKALTGKSYYSIRPLNATEESEVLPEDVVAPLGMTPSQLNELRQTEKWVGMRVDLWEDNDNGGSDSAGRLIKVKYWWRQEHVDGELKWLQCLHDIMSIGERDGSEGKEGEVLE